MKYLLIAPLSLIFATSFSFGVTCSDLNKDKEIQFEKLEAAKLRVLDQENSLMTTIQNKKDAKRSLVESGTSEKISILETIVSELKNIKNPSRRVRNAIQSIETSMEAYTSGTVKALSTFETDVALILTERSKNIESIIEIYSKDLEESYGMASDACIAGIYTEALLEESIKDARSKVIINQKNTKRMTQGIDAAYGKLNFELNKLDEHLNERLKTIRPVLRRELKNLETPLSSLHLIQM